MRILISDDSKQWGGTQKWVIEFASFLLKNAIDVESFVPQDSWISKYLTNLNIVTNTYPYSEITKKSQLHYSELASQLSNIDFVIATVYDERNNFQIIRFIAECIDLFDLRTKIIVRTGTINNNRSRRDYYPDNTSISGIVTSNQSTYTNLESVYKIKSDKLTIIPQGVCINYFSKKSLALTTKRDPNLSQFDYIFGAIGYFEERKGHRFLIDSFSNFIKENKSNHKVGLVIQGDGPLKNNLVELVARRRMGNCIFLQPYCEDPRPFYSQIDMLIHPSIEKEGLPIVILEASAMKIPTLSSNLPGIKSFIEHGNNGLLFTHLLEKDLTEKLHEIISSKVDGQLMAENSYKSVAKHYNRNIHFNNFLEYLKEKHKQKFQLELYS